MAIRIIADSADDLNDIDEQFREHFKHGEDGTIAAEFDAYFDGMRGVMKKERERAREHERRVKELEAQIESAEPGADVEELRAKLKQAETQLAEKDSAIAEQSRKFARAETERDITAAAGEIAGGSKLFSSYLREKLQYGDDGRGFVADADGNPRLDDNGDPISIRAFAAELAKDPEVAGTLPSTMRSGAGTPPGDRTGPAGRPGTGPAPRSRPMTALERRNAERKEKIEAFKAQQQQ